MQVSFKVGSLWVGDVDLLVVSRQKAIIFIASAPRVEAIQKNFLRESSGF